MKKLSESKLLFCLFFAILFFNLFPYIYQHFNNIPSKVYIGSFPILIDQSSYLAKMAQGQDGHWLIINKFTNELQRPSPVYIFYAFLGQASRFSHISLKSTLLISRFVFGFLLILTIIFFLRYFIKEKEQRIFAYLLVFFGSGLGWLGLTQNSLDLWMPDFMPMVRFSYFPHMPLATALFILTVMAMHKSFQENKKLLAIAAGGATFILNIILPFHSLLLYWVLCLYALAVFVKNPPCRRIYLKNFFIFFSFSIISFLYMFYIKETNPIWKIVEQQNILGSPSVYAIFLGFGISSLLSVAGLYLMYLKKQQTAFLFIIWPVSALTLAFLPMSIMPIQRRFLETGLFVPLAVPVSYVLFQLYQFLQNKHLIFLNKSISYTFLIYILLAFIIFPGNLTNALQFKKLIIQGSNKHFVYSSLPMYKGIQ